MPFQFFGGLKADKPVLKSREIYVTLDTKEILIGNPPNPDISITTIGRVDPSGIDNIVTFLDEVGQLKDSGKKLTDFAFKPDEITLEHNESITQIKDGGITTNKIANNNVTKDKINDDVVDNVTLERDTIEKYLRIKDNGISTNKIADNQITTQKIANNQITKDKINNDIADNVTLERNTTNKALQIKEGSISSKYIEEKYYLLLKEETLNVALSDIYGEGITIKPEFGNRFIVYQGLNYIYDNNLEIRHGLHTYYLRQGSSIPSNQKLVTIENIPARPYESFEIEFDVYSNVANNSIKVLLEAMDKAGNIVNVYSETISIPLVWTKVIIDKANGGVIGSFLANQDDSCYVNISILNNSYNIDSRVYFTTPIIKRKSKNQEVYELIASKTGLSAWSIAENTDNILSSINHFGIPVPNRIRFNFNSSINFEKYKCEIIPYSKGDIVFFEDGLTRNHSAYNYIYDGTVAKQVYYTGAAYMSSSIIIGFWGKDGTEIYKMSSENIGTNYSYIKLILKRTNVA